jgi:hypothetical protein
MLMHLKIVYEMASNFDKLLDLGYDPGDAHYIHSFFRIGLVVIDPTKSAKIHAQEENFKSDALSSIISKGKFYIDQGVKFGRLGLKNGQIKFQDPIIKDPDPKHLQIHQNHYYKKINKDVLRVQTGWLYSDWDAENDKPYNTVFVPFI